MRLLSICLAAAVLLAAFCVPAHACDVSAAFSVPAAPCAPPAAFFAPAPQLFYAPAPAVFYAPAPQLFFAPRAHYSPPAASFGIRGYAPAAAFRPGAPFAIQKTTSRGLFRREKTVTAFFPG